MRKCRKFQKILGKLIFYLGVTLVKRMRLEQASVRSIALAKKLNYDNKFKAPDTTFLINYDSEFSFVKELIKKITLPKFINLYNAPQLNSRVRNYQRIESKDLNI